MQKNRGGKDGSKSEEAERTGGADPSSLANDSGFEELMAVPESESEKRTKRAGREAVTKINVIVATRGDR